MRLETMLLFWFSCLLVQRYIACAVADVRFYLQVEQADQRARSSYKVIIIMIIMIDEYRFTYA